MADSASGAPAPAPAPVAARGRPTAAPGPIELSDEKTVQTLATPDSFGAPLAMRDPVVAADGLSYERRFIEKWLRDGNRSSPVTREPLRFPHLYPNQHLRTLIQRRPHGGTSIGALHGVDSGPVLVKSYYDARHQSSSDSSSSRGGGPCLCADATMSQ